jgi:integrase
MDTLPAESGVFGLVRASLVLALCYSNLLRISEAAGLTANDLERLHDGSFRCRVRKAKNHRLGFDFTVQCIPEAVLDAHGILSSFIERTGFKPGCAEQYLFAHKDRLAKKLAVSTLQADVKRLVILAGLDPQYYVSHCAKLGGASAAAEAGCSAPVLQEFGRWRSAESAAIYTALSDEMRLLLQARIVGAPSKQDDLFS